MKKSKGKTVKRNSSEAKNIFTKDDYANLLFMQYTLDEIIKASKDGKYGVYRVKDFKLSLTENEILRLSAVKKTLIKITNLKHTITVK